MEKVLLKPGTAGKQKLANVKSDPSIVRLPVKLSSVIFSFYENELYILLVKPDPQIPEGEWRIPSRLLHPSEELDETAANMLFELTNQKNSSTKLLDVSIGKSAGNEQLMAVRYFSCVRMEQGDTNKLKILNVKWHRITRLAWLNFNENDLVNNARIHLQYNATLPPFCFDFLPEYFTIPQFHKVYETIFGENFDRRNFSKKLLSTGLILDSGFKVDLVVTNKARLYRLDKEKYSREFCQLSNFIHSGARQSSFL